MSNKEEQLAQELDTTALDAELVADYLRANPDFFEHFPNVLQRLSRGKYLPHGVRHLIPETLTWITYTGETTQLTPVRYQC